MSIGDLSFRVFFFSVSNLLLFNSLTALVVFIPRYSANTDRCGEGGKRRLRVPKTLVLHGKMEFYKNVCI